MLINRDVKNGQHTLTGTLNTDGKPTIELFLDGKKQDEGCPSELPHNLKHQLPDRFTHIIGQIPLTADEVAPYFDAVEKHERQREQRAEDLVETYAAAEVGITRSAGIGYHLDGHDLPDLLADWLRPYVTEAGPSYDYPPAWEGFGTAQTTVSEIIERAETKKAREDEERKQSKNHYHDSRHDANCGARYSPNAACECGAR